MKNLFKNLFEKKEYSLPKSELDTSFIKSRSTKFFEDTKNLFTEEGEEKEVSLEKFVNIKSKTNDFSVNFKKRASV
jgi:hypothetical protein